MYYCNSLHTVTIFRFTQTSYSSEINNELPVCISFEAYYAFSVAVIYEEAFKKTDTEKE